MKEIIFQCNKCIVSKIFMYELFEFFQEIGLRGEWIHTFFRLSRRSVIQKYLGTGIGLYNLCSFSHCCPRWNKWFLFSWGLKPWLEIFSWKFVWLQFFKTVDFRKSKSNYQGKHFSISSLNLLSLLVSY